MSAEKEVVLRACTKCGKMFYARKGGESRCSACRKDPYGKPKKTVTKTCAHCGAAFEVPSYKSRKTYCSQKCARAVWKERYRQKYVVNREMKHCICKKCGKAFESKYARKTCFDCTEKRTESGIKITRYCECCGKAFEIPKSHYYRRFCSVECMKKGVKGKLNRVIDEYKKASDDLFAAIMKIAEKSYPERVKQLKFNEAHKDKVQKILYAENAKPGGDPFAWFYNHVLFPIAGIDYRATPAQERDLLENLAFTLGVVWAKSTTVQPAETDYKW